MLQVGWPIPLLQQLGVNGGVLKSWGIPSRHQVSIYETDLMTWMILGVSLRLKKPPNWVNSMLCWFESRFHSCWYLHLSCFVASVDRNTAQRQANLAVEKYLSVVDVFKYPPKRRNTNWLVFCAMLFFLAFFGSLYQRNHFSLAGWGCLPTGTSKDTAYKLNNHCSIIHTLW